jgi:hypothetical protein
MMAHGLVALLGSLGPLAMLAAVFLVTALIGLFISNSATAVLIAPVAIDAASALHVSPHAFAITVSIGCCAAFVSFTIIPDGHAAATEGQRHRTFSERAGAVHDLGDSPLGRTILIVKEWPRRR